VVFQKWRRNLVSLAPLDPPYTRQAAKKRKSGAAEPLLLRLAADDDPAAPLSRLLR
jgi:hypothetical protein